MNQRGRKPGRKKTAAPGHPVRLIPPEGLPPDWQIPDPGSPKAKIHQAARILFAEKGFEATSIRDITEAAGVNSAMVHYYFGSKEQLYRRVIGLEMISLFQAMDRQLAPGTKPDELLLGLPSRVARIARSNPVWAKLLRQEMATGGVQMEKVVQELRLAGPLGAKAQFERLYNEAVRQGLLRRLPVPNVIQYLIILGYSSVFYGPLFRVIAGEDPDDDKAFEDRLSVFDALIRHGLSASVKPARKS